MEPRDDDDMMSSVISQMLGDTEKHTDDTLFPPESGSGHSVTITINSAPSKEAPAPEEDEDGGYSKLMEGLK